MCDSYHIKWGTCRCYRCLTMSILAHARLTHVSAGFFFFCNTSSGGCCNPHRFSIIRVLWCCIWYLCLGPHDSINQKKKRKKKKNTKLFYLTSLWRNFNKRQNGRKPGGGEWQNLFLAVTFLGISDFHQVCGKCFWEWIVKHEKISLGSKRRTVFLSIGVPPFWNGYLTPRNFFFTLVSGKDGKTMSQGHFRK